MKTLIRWVAALIVAAVVYYVVMWVVPMAESGVSAISPKMLVLNTLLLATAAGVIAGSLTAPRMQLSFARKLFFVLGILVPVGYAVWDYTHPGTIRHAYFLMLGGAAAGAVIGFLVVLKPAPQRQPQPRRFT